MHDRDAVDLVVVQFGIAMRENVPKLDIAEFELIDRERPERANVPLPPAEDAARGRGYPRRCRRLTLLAVGSTPRPATILT
jgi:hypothetical protein